MKLFRPALLVLAALYATFGTLLLLNKHWADAVVTLIPFVLAFVLWRTTNDKTPPDLGG